MARHRPSCVEGRLEIRLLGELAVLREGEPLTLPASKKTRALLGYLVATGRSCSRERLCGLLWEIPDDPRGALRWSLSKLRPLVDGPAGSRLTADRERVGFQAAGAEVDLLRVRAVTAHGLERTVEAELRDALGRFRGPFLEGLDLPDCVRFYAWCVAERDAARALHVALLKELIARTRDRPEEALAEARALVALDPLAESSHIEVVRLLASAGRVRDAIDAYDRCRRILAEQMGTHPSAELERLRASLQAPAAGAPLPAPSGDLAPVAVPLRSATQPQRLVGRTRELRALCRLLPGAPARGNERVALLVGPPGIGKSRILEELRRSAADRGLTVLDSRAFEAEAARPYGVWVEALRPVTPGEVPDHLRADLALLLPGLGTPAPHGDQLRLFDAIAQLLRARGGRRGLVLVLDDLQWADDASASLLHFVARAAGDEVILACAARSGEVEDNVAVASVIGALDREGRLLRVEVGPLTPADTVALAREVSSAVDARRVHEISGGNPLFALELIRALMRGESDATATLSRRVRDRLDHLGDDEQTVLPWAAALGRRFDVAMLARVSGLAPARLLDALGTLERHGILVAAGTGYDFSHDVTREAAYGRVSEPRRRLLHIQIATSLWGASGDHAVDVLHHASLAGEHELAARACVAAGGRCVRVFAYADARDLSRRGLEHVAHLPERTRIPLAVELLGLRATRPGGTELEEIAGALERAGHEAEAAGLPEAAMRAFHLRSLVLYGGGDYAGAFATSRAAAEAGSVAPATAAALNLLGHARCLAMLERDMEAAARALDRAAETLGPEPDALDFRWARGLLRRFQGDSEAAAADLTWAAARTEHAQRHWERCWCLAALAVSALERGDPSAAAQWAAQLEDIASRIGEGVERAAARAVLALAALRRGEGTWRAVDAALEAVRDCDAKATLAVLANLAAEWALAEGNEARAIALAQEALAAGAAVSQASQTLLARSLLANVALRRNDEASAAALAREIDEALALGPWAVSARVRATALSVRAAVVQTFTPRHAAAPLPAVSTEGG